MTSTFFPILRPPAPLRKSLLFSRSLPLLRPQALGRRASKLSEVRDDLDMPCPQGPQSILLMPFSCDARCELLSPFDKALGRAVVLVADAIKPNASTFPESNPPRYRKRVTANHALAFALTSCQVAYPFHHAGNAKDKDYVLLLQSARPHIPALKASMFQRRKGQATSSQSCS